MEGRESVGLGEQQRHSGCLGGFGLGSWNGDSELTPHAKILQQGLFGKGTCGAGDNLELPWTENGKLCSDVNQLDDGDCHFTCQT